VENDRPLRGRLLSGGSFRDDLRHMTARANRDRRPERLRTFMLAAVASVVFALGVLTIPAQASAAPHHHHQDHQAPARAAGNSKTTSARKGKAKQTAKLRHARHRRHRGHSVRVHESIAGHTPAPQPTAPAPEPTPNPEPVPKPTSSPEPSPSPSPSPEPTSAPASEPTTEPSPTANGDLLFDGSFAKGFSSWYVQSLSYRATLVSSGDPAVGEAGRFEVRDGDVEPDTGSQRSEVVGPTFSEGQDLYIHDSIRIPSANSYNAPWQIIQQLHEDSSVNSPSVAVFLENSHALRISSGDSSRYFWQGPKLQTDRWYDLVYRVLLSQNPGVGLVEVWLDGVPQEMVNGQTRIYGPTATATRTFLKAGVYRSRYSTGTSIVEHGDIKIGTSLGAVEG